jgi:hypothetical protein
LLLSLEGPLDDEKLDYRIEHDPVLIRLEKVHLMLERWKVQDDGEAVEMNRLLQKLKTDSRPLLNYIQQHLKRQGNDYHFPVSVIKQIIDLCKVYNDIASAYNLHYPSSSNDRSLQLPLLDSSKLFIFRDQLIEPCVHIVKDFTKDFEDINFSRIEKYKSMGIAGQEVVLLDVMGRPNPTVHPVGVPFGGRRRSFSLDRPPVGGRRKRTKKRKRTETRRSRKYIRI